MSELHTQVLYTGDRAMSILKKTSLGGTVQSLLLHSKSQGDIESTRIDSVPVTFAGLDGDSHSGLTRESCVRVKQQYPPGTPIRNTRQLSIVSVEELEIIASEMQVSTLEPEWLGANLCVEGIPDLTKLPPSTRMIFSNGLSLVVDMENAPCKYPAERIDLHFPGKGRKFVKCATGRRGVTAWVECEGKLSRGDEFLLHLPPQRLYSHAG